MRQVSASWVYDLCGFQSRGHVVSLCPCQFQVLTVILKCWINLKVLCGLGRIEGKRKENGRKVQDTQREGWEREIGNNQS